jgi:hypothetical protein
MIAGRKRDVPIGSNFLIRSVHVELLIWRFGAGKKIAITTTVIAPIGRLM